MQNLRVAVVDYGVGNLFSIKRALEHLGAEVVISDDVELLSKEQKIILPGVGSFEKGMYELKKRGLDKMLKESAEKGNTILGICLGMQLLMSKSYEYGEHEGLNLIEGKVVLFPKGGSDKIPHVGWNSLKDPIGKTLSQATIFNSIKNNAFVYFVHSYMVVPEHDNDIISLTEYADVSYCSAIQNGSVMGCQFHPELSSEIGLKVLNNFLHI